MWYTGPPFFLLQRGTSKEDNPEPSSIWQVDIITPVGLAHNATTGILLVCCHLMVQKQFPDKTFVNEINCAFKSYTCITALSKSLLWH